MMMVIDADAHVEESPAAFSDKYLATASRDRVEDVGAGGVRQSA